MTAPNPALELRIITTQSGYDVQIWLKAGNTVDAVDLVLNYDASKSSLSGNLMNEALTGWTWLSNPSTLGSLITSGYSLTPINAVNDTLLQTLSYTSTGSKTDFSFALVAGTDLYNNSQIINLGDLPFINSLTEADGNIYSGGNIDSTFDAAVYLGTYGNLYIDGLGNWNYQTNGGYNEFIFGNAYKDIFNLTDKHGQSTNLIFTINGTNDAPTLSAFTSYVNSGPEDTQINITFDNLKTQGNESDIDGTVDSFVVKTINSGTLLIGTSAATATLWDTSNNNTIDATHQAFWIPDLNTNGTLSAFSVVAKDNQGLESLSFIPTVSSFVAPTTTHNLTEDVTFWKTGVAISNVTSTVISTPSNPNTSIEFKNIQVNPDGSRTLDIWETSSGVNNLDLHLSLPSASVASWTDANNLPASWTSTTNTQRAGHFDLAGIGLNALSSGSVKLGTLTISNPNQATSLNVQLSTALLGNERIIPFAVSTDSTNSLTANVYTHNSINDGVYGLSTTKSALTIGNAIDSNDALNALKIAVGINPNQSGTNVSPYQYLAADINHDGRVNAPDALNILKMAVNLNTAPEKTWLFVPNTVGTETMSRTSVNWTDTINPVTVNQDQTIHLVGVVAGDIDGSWVNQ